MRALIRYGFCLTAFIAVHAFAEVEVRLGQIAASGSLLAKSAEEFAARANSRLGGKAKVSLLGAASVFGAGKSGGDTELLQKLKAGSVDLGLAGSVMSSESDLFGIFDMPYLVKDRKHMGLIEREIVWPRLAPEAERKGLKIIAVWENGYRHVTNNRLPIRVPADLRGIRLRVPEGIWRVKMFQSYGTEPSPLKFSEVYKALQSGALDGQENPFTVIYSAKLQEVQKFLSLTGHVYTPAYLTAGLSTWTALPADVRKVLEDTAKEVQAFVYATAEQDENELLGKLRAAGMQVNEVDKAAFIDASKPIYEQFGKEVPGSAELIERALALGR